MANEPLTNGAPEVYFVGAELWFTPTALGLNATAIGLGATIRSNAFDLRGMRNFTVYFNVVSGATTSVTITIETYTPDAAATLIRNTSCHAGAITQASGWTADDGGVGAPTVLPGAVFGLCKIKCVEGGVAAGTVSCWIAARA